VVPLEVDWRPFSWGTVGVGISTFQPIRRPDGTLANPFVRYSRDNYTTVFLSLSVSAEAVAEALRRDRRPR